MLGKFLAQQSPFAPWLIADGDFWEGKRQFSGRDLRVGVHYHIAYGQAGEAFGIHCHVIRQTRAPNLNSPRYTS